MDQDTNPLDVYEADPQDDEEERVESEGEGEDLLENMERDYQPQPHLDHYDPDGLDDEEPVEVDLAEQMAAVRAAEEELDRRDARKSGRRLPEALGEDDDDGDFNRRRRKQRRQSLDLFPTPSTLRTDTEPQPELQVDIFQVNGRLSDWVAQDFVAREVKRRFRNFLKTFGTPEQPEYYLGVLKLMMNDNHTSLEVHYNHLSSVEPSIAVWLADSPRQMLEYVDEAATEVIEQMYSERMTSMLHNEHGAEFRIHVRLSDLPISDTIRDLRNFHLNTMVRVSGVVTRRTGVFPQLRLIKYDCVKCGYTLGPFAMNTEQEVKPHACPSCSSKGPFNVNSSETVYRNYQKLALQESPGSVPAGRLPRSKEVILTSDLIDCARPGEEIEVTGLYTYGYDASLNVKNSFPVFATHIEANFVKRKEDVYAGVVTEEDRSKILELSRQPRIGERIIKSIAPSIYGHENIKTGLALALLGGVEKTPSPAHRLRGDINVLLLGDPGVAKSQFLKYVEKTAPRAVYTTGKGASAVGLTAAVTKDPITREWTLEGGALVLADKGVCLIDEFDKMNDQDRVSIHEAMEQQSISISKAGIVTQLQARCAVIAAANPIGGRYDPSRTLAENVELSDPILSRFDIMVVIRDIVDPVNDEKLAQFVVGNHARSHPAGPPQDDAPETQIASSADASQDPDILPQELLRKYIQYAKHNCRPTLQQADYDRILKLYAALRQEAAITHGMPVAVRHLESVVRMSEASARMHLRDYVTDYDINVAIKMMVSSFIQSQKFTVQQTLERKFSRYLTLPSDFNSLLLSLLRGLVRREQHTAQLEGRLAAQIKITGRSLEERAAELDIADVSAFLASTHFRTAGFSHDRATNTITFTAT